MHEQVLILQPVDILCLSGLNAKKTEDPWVSVSLNLAYFFSPYFNVAQLMIE